MKVKVVQSCLTLCDLMELSMPEYWHGWSIPSPGDLANPGIKPGSPTLQDSLPAELPGKPFLTYAYKLTHRLDSEIANEHRIMNKIILSLICDKSC